MENTQGNIPSEGSQPTAPVPSANQEPVAETPVVAPSQEQPVQTQETTLPEGTKERTAREFEKLKEQLRFEREERRRLTEQSQLPPVYDPNTNYVNGEVLSSMQQEVYKNRAELDSLRRDQALREEERSKAEMLTAYPQLDPLAKNYDEGFDNLTASIWYHASIAPDRYGGKMLTFKEAADRAKQVTNKDLESARAQGAQQAIEQVTSKEQATLAGSGSTVRRNQVSTDTETLRKQTRSGNLDAMVARMRAMKK